MRYTIKFVFLRFGFVATSCLTWGCASIAQTTGDLPIVQEPEQIEYIETEDTHYAVSYTCFKLAEKTKQAFDAHQTHDKTITRKKLFLGALDCTSEPTGRYAFVHLHLSIDKDNYARVMTGPTVYATTSDGAETFKWSVGW